MRFSPNLRFISTAENRFWVNMRGKLADSKTPRAKAKQGFYYSVCAATVNAEFEKIGCKGAANCARKE
jgi:hypothetical protein